MIRIGDEMLCVASLFALGCAPNPGLERSEQTNVWTEVATDHFVSSSNLAAPAAIDMAQTLEETRAAGAGLDRCERAAWTHRRGGVCSPDRVRSLLGPTCERRRSGRHA